MKMNFGTLLSRSEMKEVMGGKQAQTGTCASQNAGGEVMYNLTQAQASGVGAGGHWCCSSCSSASWYCPGGGEGACA